MAVTELKRGGWPEADVSSGNRGVNPVGEELSRDGRSAASFGTVTVSPTSLLPKPSARRIRPTVSSML